MGSISEFSLYSKNVVWATQSTRRKTMLFVLCLSVLQEWQSNFKFRRLLLLFWLLWLFIIVAVVLFLFNNCTRAFRSKARGSLS